MKYNCPWYRRIRGTIIPGGSSTGNRALVLATVLALIRMKRTGLPAGGMARIIPGSGQVRRFEVTIRVPVLSDVPLTARAGQGGADIFGVTAAIGSASVAHRSTKSRDNISSPNASRHATSHAFSSAAALSSIGRNGRKIRSTSLNSQPVRSGPRKSRAINARKHTPIRPPAHRFDPTRSEARAALKAIAPRLPPETELNANRCSRNPGTLSNFDRTAAVQYAALAPPPALATITIAACPLESR